jgi:hypothetical protein
MAEAKIDFKVGGVSFAAEGSEKWLSGELSRVLEKVPELANMVRNGNGSGDGSGTETHGHQHNKGNVGTLASYLKEKKAIGNQCRTFLATAAYLHDSGDRRLTTGQVKKALSTNNQGKLSNASAALNENVHRGFCEKNGKIFFVTDAGWSELG